MDGEVPYPKQNSFPTENYNNKRNILAVVHKRSAKGTCWIFHRQKLPTQELSLDMSLQDGIANNPTNLSTWLQHPFFLGGWHASRC